MYVRQEYTKKYTKKTKVWVITYEYLFDSHSTNTQEKKKLQTSKSTTEWNSNTFWTVQWKNGPTETLILKSMKKEVNTIHKTQVKAKSRVE